MNRKLIRKKRVLFFIDECPRCRIWIEFIERYNANLPPQKQIELIDCTMFNLYGIVTHPIINIYDKDILGYPTLFFGTRKLDGTNTRPEAEAWLKTALRNDLINPVDNPYVFNKRCYKRKTKLWRQKVICE